MSTYVVGVNDALAVTLRGAYYTAPAVEVPVGTPIPPPSGFGLTPPFTISRLAAGDITHNLNPDTLIPFIDVQYYVDPINGSDSNSGLTMGLPLLSLSVALAKAPSGTTIGIEIINLMADFIARTTAGWNNVIPTKSVVVRNRTGSRFQCVKVGSATPAVYTDDGTFPGVVYSTVIALPLSVVDLKNKSQPSIVIPDLARQKVDGVYVLGNGVASTTVNNAPPIYQTMTNVASLALVNSTAGSWFHDGTNLKVRPYDNRDLKVAGNAATIIPTVTGNSGRPCSTNNSVTYIQGIDFVGGVTPFIASNASSVTGRKLVFNSCSFQGSGTGANGMSVTAFLTVYSYRSGAYYNNADGFNYHSFENDSGATLGTSPTFYELECVAVGNGTTGSANTSDNATTSHDDCRSVRVNNITVNSDDGVSIETNFAQSWNLGCFVGQAIKVGAGKENVQAIATTKVYMDTLVLPTGGGNNQVGVGTGCTMGYTHMTAPTQGGAGSLTPY